MNNKIRKLELIEKIKVKAHQLDSISLIAQDGDFDGLHSEITENLFGLMSNLSRDIVTLTEHALNAEESNA